MWKEVSKGKFTWTANVTAEQLLARYVLLGADLRELDEAWNDPDVDVKYVKQLLAEIIKQHEQIPGNAQL